MKKFWLAPSLIGAIAITGLAGCEQIEQATNEAVDKARQTAVETLDQARQAGSVEEAKQTADNAFQDLKRQAAGLLQQASDYLSGNEPAQPDAEPQQAPAAEPRVDG